ncbi:MAG: helical backbone metal receptor [Desulfurococcaceae archaeon]
MSKHVYSLILFAMIFCALTSIQVASSEFEIEIVDALQRHVEIRYPLRRVISLVPSLTETLVALDLDEYLVGVDSFSLSDWFINTSERLKSRNAEEVGGYWWSTIRVEKILELNPDLVLADSLAHKPLLEVFERYNITVFYFSNGRSISDVYSNIYTVGLIFNKTGEAQNLIEEIEYSLEAAREKLKPYMGTKVIVVVDFWQGIWVAGKATYLDDLIARMGLTNVAPVYGWSPVSVEAISNWNPDVIIIACPYATEDTVANSGLLDLNRKIAVLNSTEVDIISRPGPTLLLAPAILHNLIARNQPSSFEVKTSSNVSILDTYVKLFALAITCGAIGYFIGLKRGPKP